MFELILMAFIVVAAARTATQIRASELIWAVLAAGLCFAACILMPGWPFVRVVLAALAYFVAWMAYICVRDMPGRSRR